MVAGKMFQAMTNGVNAGNMASYASQIPVKDRWAIIAYIRRDIQQVPYENAGAVVVVKAGASAENGAAFYKTKGCNACHSIDGSKIVGPSFKGLWGRTEKTSAGDVKVDEAYLVESMANPMAKIVDGYPPAMPPQNLTPDEQKSLVMYIETLK